ncbi:four helix bundle protein [Abyssalbus ytuae]|uniref:Four helix bundle protein n=1 Tax=Abyssalbus ytuae TaxID=2926907 RepID=A0A9E6ZTU7_9FLAO|nr:four helix bundle protein [Abyssalbus ytuae]UOB18783.1 four helix bundle protein [Abyssalbus ytuae]
MKENVIREKSFSFALDIVYLYKELVKSENEYIMSRQLLESGTSIGANIREAEFGQNRLDFINKMPISLKEANETYYWLDLLHATEYIDKVEYEHYKSKSTEILKLLVSIVKSAKNNF